MSKDQQNRERSVDSFDDTDSPEISTTSCSVQSQSIKKNVKARFDFGREVDNDNPPGITPATTPRGRTNSRRSSKHRRRSSCSSVGSIIHDRLSVMSTKVDEFEEILDETDGAGPYAMIFNMCKASTSNGILSIPLAFAYMGVPLAISVCAWSAFIYGFGYYILGIETQKLKGTSYADIWSKSIGPKTTWIVDVFQIGNGFASCLSFCMVFGNIFAQPFKDVASLQDTILAKKQFWIILIGTVIVFPVCLPKKLNVLRYTSFIGIVCILFGIGWVTAQGFGDTVVAQRWRSGENGIFETDTITWKMVAVFALMGSAFTGHMNGPRYFYELKDKSTKNWAMICVSAHVCLFVVNVLLGLAGLAAFGGHELLKNDSGGNIFKMFEQNKPHPHGLYYTSMFCVAFSLLFALPLSFIGARQGFVNICQTCNAPFKGEDASRIVITAAGLALTFLIACLVDNLTYVNIIKGMVFSISLSSLLPGIIWLRLGKAEYNRKCKEADEDVEQALLGKEKKEIKLPERPKWMTVCAVAQIIQASACFICGCISLVDKFTKK